MAANAKSSPACAVVTVGASVDPYVRFTTQPSRSAASATNAAVTPAPPHDTRRNDSTRAGAKPGAPINPTKNVGGPIMNVMPSRSMRDSASSGSQRAMSTHFIGTTAGSSTPLSKPEMSASGAGMRIASSGVNPWTRAISEPLYVNAWSVCMTPFGVPLEPDVNRIAATSSGSAMRRGSSAADITSTSARPARWWIGAATAPICQQAW